ncbi:hypothetical protein LDENG_00274340, partial [Lucifuga dentata]
MNVFGGEKMDVSLSYMDDDIISRCPIKLQQLCSIMADVKLHLPPSKGSSSTRLQDRNRKRSGTAFDSLRVYFERFDLLPLIRFYFL